MANKPIPFQSPRMARTAYGSGTRESVLATLEENLKIQEELCFALERIADGLPANVANDDCVALSRRIYPIMHGAHAFEEGVLFPMIERSCAGQENIRKTLDRLHGEHWEDESYAEEISHALAGFVYDRAADRAETLGYMLRGFFEGVRRHIAFEREHLFPLIEQLDIA